ncbi:MAG: TIGR04211 family SH3 domain-containing protein [Deltaproteobacteria bacterium]|nr:TIGR04211 family SH3 domain-containing protein [Deltaproteobacteria bacterium]
MTDVFDVMVRTGPDISHKIIAMPKSGTQIEILEAPDEQEDSEWAAVRLPNGKEGWILSQYLIFGPPKKELIARLQKENDSLTQKEEVLVKENRRLKQEQKEVKKALTLQTKRANTLEQSYEKLKSESKNFLALKGSHEKASQELDTKTNQVEKLKKELDALQKNQTLWWFIAGASIILVGFLIGYLSRRPKRRPSLL